MDKLTGIITKIKTPLMLAAFITLAILFFFNENIKEILAVGGAGILPLVIVGLLMFLLFLFIAVISMGINLKEIESDEKQAKENTKVLLKELETQEKIELARIESQKEDSVKVNVSKNKKKVDANIKGEAALNIHENEAEVKIVTDSRPTDEKKKE